MDGRSFYPGDDPYWCVFLSMPRKSRTLSLFPLSSGKQWTFIIGRRTISSGASHLLLPALRQRLIISRYGASQSFPLHRDAG
jgi:hypothetical protein